MNYSNKNLEEKFKELQPKSYINQIELSLNKTKLSSENSNKMLGAETNVSLSLRALNENFVNKNESEPFIGKFYCQLCKLSLLSAIQLEQHSSGKKHLKKLNSELNKNVSFKCDICDTSMISKAQYMSHVSGKKHFKKLASVSPTILEKIQQSKKQEYDKYFENIKIDWDKYKISDKLRQETQNRYDFYCFLCNKFIQKKPQLVDHLRSKKHHKKIHIQRKKAKQNEESINSDHSDKQSKFTSINKSDQDQNFINRKRKNDDETILSESKKISLETYNENSANSL